MSANPSDGTAAPCISLGLTADGTEVYWEPHTLPHALVIGGTGSSKNPIRRQQADPNRPPQG